MPECQVLCLPVGSISQNSPTAQPVHPAPRMVIKQNYQEYLDKIAAVSQKNVQRLYKIVNICGLVYLESCALIYEIQLPRILRS